MKGNQRYKIRSVSRAHLTISYSFCVICCKVKVVGILDTNLSKNEFVAGRHDGDG